MLEIYFSIIIQSRNYFITRWLRNSNTHIRYSTAYTNQIKIHFIKSLRKTEK